MAMRVHTRQSVMDTIHASWESEEPDKIAELLRPFEWQAHHEADVRQAARWRRTVRRIRREYGG